jgi:hypothetical protein
MTGSCRSPLELENNVVNAWNSEIRMLNDILSHCRVCCYTSKGLLYQQKVNGRDRTSLLDLQLHKIRLTAHLFIAFPY